MTQCNFAAEQARLLAEAGAPVAICRADGIVVGWKSANSPFVIPAKCPFMPEEIEAAEKEAASDGPWHTTQEVLAYCRNQEASR